MAEMAESERRCESCGCTDEHACPELVTVASCYWVDGFAGDLCSVCARRIFYAAAHSPMIDPEWGPALRIALNRAMVADLEPFVVLADGPEADELIRELRAGGPLS